MAIPEQKNVESWVRKTMDGISDRKFKNKT